MIITTPDHAHCAVLSGVVRAGKDAYVEKPLCARLESAKRQIATRAVAPPRTLDSLHLRLARQSA